jgi:hypothetical protein
LKYATALGAAISSYELKDRHWPLTAGLWTFPMSAPAAYPPLDRQQEIKALQVDIKTSINLEGFIPKN